jgi:tripartite-type tricarboxylate transporter receptor subunit TctC
MKQIIRSTRRAVVAALASALPAVALAFATPAAAQSYPERPVRIVVPFPPGGSNDVIARILAQKLSADLGQQFIVENRAGAGGNTGAESVVRSAPDGYTLLLAAPGPLAINPTLIAKLPFDPAKDFAPVALVASVPIILMVHPGVAAQNVKDLIALAKKQPGKLNFGSSGIGATNHLAGELFKNLAEIDIAHVAYRGAAPAMNDLLGGHIPILFDNMPAVLPHMKAGKVRALAVASAKRVSALPDLPTVAEAGPLPGFEATAWFGLVAPAKTPEPVLARLSQAVEKALADPDVTKRFAELGAEPGGAVGAKFGAFLQAETAKWADVIRKANVKVE